MHLNLWDYEYILYTLLECSRKHSLHKAPSRQTAKIIYGKCDSGISGMNLYGIYVTAPCVGGEKACATSRWRECWSIFLKYYMFNSVRLFSSWSGRVFFFFFFCIEEATWLKVVSPWSKDIVDSWVKESLSVLCTEHHQPLWTDTSTCRSVTVTLSISHNCGFKICILSTSCIMFDGWELKKKTVYHNTFLKITFKPNLS